MDTRVFFPSTKARMASSPSQGSSVGTLLPPTTKAHSLSLLDQCSPESGSPLHSSRALAGEPERDANLWDPPQT